ncbi:MAG: alpha/beta fold hydrolase [Phycisphaerales bacterium]
MRTHPSVYLVGVMLASTALLGGCYSYHGAPRSQNAASAEVPAGAWTREPALANRDEQLAALRALGEDVDASGREGVGIGAGAGGAVGSESDSAVRARRTVTASMLTQHGLLRAWDERGVTDQEPREDAVWGPMLDIEDNAAFLTVWRQAWLDEIRAAEDAARAEFPPGAPSDTISLTARSTAGSTPGRLTDGVGLRLPTEVDDDPAGIIVYLPALIPNIYEYRVVEAFRDRGWAMVFVDGASRVHAPNAAAVAGARERRSLLGAQRIQETTAANRAARERGERSNIVTPDFRAIMEEGQRRYPDPPTGFELDAWESPEALGAAIAASVDALLLEHALAAEAAVRFTLEQHPSLSGKPIVIAGFSGGSLAAPAIAARLREALPGVRMALVLVGSGGDALSVALRSDVSDGGIRLVPKGQTLPENERDRLIDAYRAASTLDPLRMIASIREVPVLHVYATRDKAVPTDLARALNEAHGRTARLVHLGDHYGLFGFLGGQRGRIVRWSERAVRETE